MRTCPSCGAKYEPPAQFCLKDGTALHIDAPPKDPYLGTKILGQFRLERVLGAGGMGVVYEGWDEGLGRKVAVKILHRDLVTNKDVVSRFHREAQIAHSLDHPGIVRVVLFGQLPDGNLYLVLEFLEGPTLMEALESSGPFTPGRAVRIIGAIADAIGYAHNKGIVHRDLKPENVIITSREGEEFPKVLDFGIARMLIGSSSFVTQTGLIFGTARYISPEGASGDAVDQRGDVYSLGVMTYQLLTGHTPFDADEPVQLLVKHLHETPPLMRRWPAGMAVPPAVEGVVMRALRKHPDGRYDNAAMYAQALREALGESGPELGSIVKTTAMVQTPSPRPSETLATPIDPVQPIVGVVQPTREARISAPSEPPRERAPLPVTVAENAQVAVVRTSRRSVGADRRDEARSEAPRDPSLHAAPNGAVVPPAPAALPPRVEMPVVAAPMIAAQVVATPTVAAPRVEAISRPLHIDDAPLAPSTRELDPHDDIVVEGLPRRRSGGARTAVVVLFSIVFTLLAALAAAYGLRWFPSQRRADVVAELTRRAQDALRLGRIMHDPAGNDVEDLTDAVLVLHPRHPRALQLRRTAAVQLKSAADAQRMEHHPERAIPLLEDALRLIDDATLREDLAAARREDEQLHARPSTPTRPATPTHAAPAHPAPSRAPVAVVDGGAPSVAQAAPSVAQSAPSVAPSRTPTRAGRHASPSNPPANPSGITFTPDPARRTDPGTVVQTPLGPMIFRSNPDPEPPPQDPLAPRTGEF